MTPGRVRGFTYLVALLAIAVAGSGVAAVGESWAHARQREKEAELLWIGEQFRQAIGLYYHRTPGALKRYPEKLEDLLDDRRFPTVQRYLRRLYVDPISGEAEWGVVRATEGGIMGVHSLSELSTRKQVGQARSYAEWKFVYEPLVSAAPKR